MPHSLARRVAGFDSSIFSEITALALQHNAVNLGQGFPDFAGPAFIKQAAADAIAADLNQYAPSPGLPRLRQAVAAHWQHWYGHEIDWRTDVTVASGATEVLYSAILGLLDPGNKAIMFEPAYDAYAADLTLVGAEPVVVRLHPPTTADRPPTEDDSRSSVVGRPSSDWWFDPDELRAAFAQQPKLIILNTPHNPTGKVFTRIELELIATLCQEHDVLALSDEVYDQIVYDDLEHIPLATLPGMWERTLTVNSIGKTFSVTGWKIGYAVGPAHLNHALRQAHQWTTFATSTPMQEASAVALEQARHNGYYDQLRQEYDARRRLLTDILEEAGLPTFSVAGAYFVNTDITALGYHDDRDFCRWLVAEIGVAAIPVSVFYVNQNDVPPIVRFCFAKRHETLLAAGERLAKVAVKG